MGGDSVSIDICGVNDASIGKEIEKHLGSAVSISTRLFVNSASLKTSIDTETAGDILILNTSPEEAAQILETLGRPRNPWKLVLAPAYMAGFMSSAVREEFCVKPVFFFEAHDFPAQVAKLIREALATNPASKGWSR